MPRQDAQGRWISDDGLSYWDGAAWRQIGAQPVAPFGYAVPAKAKSPWPAILVGCGVALVVVIVLGIVGTFALISNPDFQRGFCNSYANSNRNLTCPFHPSSP